VEGYAVRSKRQRTTPFLPFAEIGERLAASEVAVEAGGANARGRKAPAVTRGRTVFMALQVENGGGGRSHTTGAECRPARPPPRLRAMPATSSVIVAVFDACVVNSH